MMVSRANQVKVKSNKGLQIENLVFKFWAKYRTLGDLQICRQSNRKRMSTIIHRVPQMLQDGVNKKLLLP